VWLTIRPDGEPDRTVRVGGERVVIGRDLTCDVVLEDEKVSRRHASLRLLSDGRVFVEDLGSTNGTLVNGWRIGGPVILGPGDRVRLGDTLLWTSPTGAGSKATVVVPGPRPDLAPTPASAPAPPAPATPTEPPPPGRAAPGRRGVLGLPVPAAVALAIVLGAAAVAIPFAVVGGNGEPSSPATGTASPSAPPSIPEIIEAVRPSVVLVDVSVGGQSVGGGSGWVLDAERGLIVTNAHVVNAGTEFSVGLASERRTAEIVGVAPCEDLAVLRVADTEGLRTLPMGSQSDLRQGQTVIALGFPASASLTAELTATTGIVSVVQTAFDRESLDVPKYPNVIQTDAALNPGNSGGPLIDEAGRLVGVNSAGITLLGGRTIQGQGYAIGVDRVREVVAILEAGSSIGWTGMGFEYPSSTEELDRLGLPRIAGLLVANAVPGTPAAVAGFGGEPALIVEIQGRRVLNDLPSYCGAVEDLASGSTASFTVVRPASDVAVEVAVGFA
jgi:S1-C subfamily serine protease